MIGLPSASSSFRVAYRDVLSAANRTPFRWNVNSGSAGRGDSFASATSMRPAVHPAKIAAASCRRWGAAFKNVVCRPMKSRDFQTAFANVLLKRIA
jgi:hypothetical protein